MGIHSVSWDQFFKGKTHTICVAGLNSEMGKTTIAYELGKLLGQHCNVLLVDMDPKGDLCALAGEQPDPYYYSMADVLTKETGITSVMFKKEYFELAVATKSLDTVKDTLLHPVDGIMRLKEVIKPIQVVMDVTIIDCPPGLNRLTQNAIVASDMVITPIAERKNNQHSVRLLNQEVETVRKYFAPDLMPLQLLRLVDGDDESARKVDELLEQYKEQLLATTIEFYFCQSEKNRIRFLNRDTISDLAAELMTTLETES